jgi:hypothetical protein
MSGNLSFEHYLSQSGLTMQLSGFSATITQPETNIDVTWTEDRQIQGGILEVSGFDVSDTVDVLAGVMAGSTFVPVGPPLALNLAVPPDGAIDTIVQTTKEVPGGVILRIVYKTSAPSPAARVGGYWRTWFKP